MKKILLTVITVFLISAVLTGSVQADESGIPFTEDPEALEQAAMSVVKLEVFNGKDERISTGSGFAAFDPAVLVTACHVIENMEYIIATRDDGTTFRIERVYDADEDADVALCELPEDAGLTVLTCIEDKLLRGEKTAAIGSQFGLVNLVTLGNFCGYWETEKVTWILFTSPVSSGNSGGPLLNNSGEVIGVVTGTYEKGQNLNLAAPIHTAAALMD